MTDAKILKLETTRQVLIDKLERIKVYVDDKLLESTSTYARVRLDALENTFEQFNVHQSALEHLVEDTKNAQIRAKFEETYFELKPAILEHIETVTSTVKPETRPILNQGNVIAKLPRIEIRVFTGDFTKWLDFYNTFDSLVHKNSQLNTLSKFQHLRNSVDGAAAELIRSLELTEANYIEALNLLKGRYNNSKIICRDHMRNIFNIQRIIKPSAEKLSKLINQLNSNLRSLNSLERPTQYWDELIIEILLPKLDPDTISKWEDEEPADALPTLKEFIAFLNKRLHSLEGRTAHNPTAVASSQEIGSRPKLSRSSHSTTVNSHTRPKFACVFCEIPGHRINQCRRFLRLSIAERRNEINNRQICINCLRNDHQINSCSSPFHCNKPNCSIRHHSLLHSDVAQPRSSTTESNDQNGLSKTTIHHSANNERQDIFCNSTSNVYVFLATALVTVLDQSGTPVIARALLDSGSQLNLITHKFAAQLGLKRKSFNTSITGIGASSLSCKSMLTINIQSRINAYAAKIDAHVLSKITGLQPTTGINTGNWTIPQNIKLADPEFSIPQHIDLLLGADIYYSLQAVGQIKLGPDMPMLQNTLLGWVVVGKTTNYALSLQNYHVCNVLSAEENGINELLQKFFDIENFTDERPTLSKTEQYVENHFEKHYIRNAEGKFIVKLPMSQPPSVLGNSQNMALRRFKIQEHRLNKNEGLKRAYQETIEEYLQLGHMKQVTSEEVATTHFFLPHHCVFKPESSTTKMRVVFDASAKSDSGKALNDILMVGPVLQQDLLSILTRFRTYKYVFSADICKMYRQILVTDDDAQLQHIFWRNNSSETLRMYRLLTLTFGTSSASYLATKCVQKLADIYQQQYPKASEVIKRDIYVDDLLTGSNNLEDAKTIKTQITNILSTAGMNLRKWCTNDQSILVDEPQEYREKLLRLDNGDFIKTLGMYWQPSSDVFRFNVNIKDHGGRITRRTVLSDIARIFDPLGLTAPAITRAKIYLQQTWMLKQDWDQSLPQNLFTFWQDFRNQLVLLNDLQVKRQITLTSSGVVYDIHGFADASEKAFGAVIYLRSQNGNSINVQLICAKSRVAPLSKTTIPRLELCAALLLAELVKRITPILNINIRQIFYWSDSTITLSWLKTESATLTTFVGNRVAKIQRLTAISEWHHINTKFNPADLLSRGCSPLELLQSASWFTGPIFLQASPAQWPISCAPVTDDIPERRKAKTILVSSVCNNEEDILQRFKSRDFLSVQRIMAYVYRFVYNCRSKQINNRLYGDINPIEIQNGLNLIIKAMQFTCFNVQIRLLKAKKPLSHKDLIISLSPFLDGNGILRVGGRLKHSALAYSTKYPILLPSIHPITISILSCFHKKLFHAGAQALLAAVRQEYWPLNGRRLAKRVCHDCIRCFRFRARTSLQKMGDLPTERVTCAPPFFNVGVDFAGPFFIHHRIRGKGPTKGYLAIFVCLAVKAVHLELVSDLSSDAFIGALKRFIATRGMCKNIFSDNGTNFVGTNTALHELYNLFKTQHFKDDILHICQADMITWHFAPPSAPHFGGIYEAAVKSAKHHLRRIMGDSSLTYEEMNTTFKQVEAVLNSRPLTPLSADPNDLEAITPGHFLVGRPLTTILEPNIENERITYLKRWRHVQQLHQHFWSRWSNEYLLEMQHRRKWTTSSRNIDVGELVLIKDDNLPPLKWKMGRVLEVHPGSDQLIRVVTLKTQGGIMKRPITKICPFPSLTLDTTLKAGSIQGGDDG